MSTNLPSDNHSEQANSKGKQHQPPSHDIVKESLYGLLGGGLLIIIGVLVAHFMLGMPLFP